ncbi:MAG: DivIVA domain-containing protein [Acidimicrobiales bacterium]
MDITPQVINEVEFPLKVRGYDPDEVDDFLERMAVGVGQLQERLQQVTERAATAERRAVELEQSAREMERMVADRPDAVAASATPAAPADETEQLSRTLTMAQRFVDQAMREAQEEADRLVGEARTRTEQLRAEADAELRRARAESHTQIADEVAQLEQARDSLQGDVDALTAHVEAHRERLKAALAEFAKVLDHPDTLRAEPPELSGAALPTFARDVVPDEEPAEIATPDRSDVTPAPEPEPAPAAPAAQGIADEGSAPAEIGDEAWSRFAQGPEGVEAGPPTATYAEGDAQDPYLDELRRAIGGDAGESAAGDNGLFDQDDDPGYRPRFGRR